MTATEELALLEARIATAVNEGDIRLADKLREQSPKHSWRKAYEALRQAAQEDETNES